MRLVIGPAIVAAFVGLGRRHAGALAAVAGACLVFATETQDEPSGRQSNRGGAASAYRD